MKITKKVPKKIIYDLAKPAKSTASSKRKSKPTTKRK